MNISDLSTHGFVTLSYPLSLRMAVDKSMESWRQFCSMSDEEKKIFSDGDRLKDFGYMRRADRVGKADDKEIFEVVERDLKEITRRAEKVQQAWQFISQIILLLKHAKPRVLEFAKQVENHYEIPGFAETVEKSSDHWTFRYIHYMPSSHPMLAHPHADRGGFTLHLQESHYGGEYLGLDHVWRPWPVSMEETIIFPSMVLQHRSEGRLNALWHRVVTTETTKVVGRYSMVAFIDFPHSHRWNDAKYRIQDLQPGFNYGLRPEEFPESDMFVSTG